MRNLQHPYAGHALMRVLRADWSDQARRCAQGSTQKAAEAEENPRTMGAKT